MSEIKAVLCDIGGVLYVGDTPIEAAIEAVARIKERYLKEHDANAYFLLTDEAKKQFKNLTCKDIKYVVVGDAQENFSYKSLNTAFRHLHSGATLLAAAKNRYFKDADGELSMDAGGFVQALEYASQT